MNQKFNLLFIVLALFSFSALQAATITFTGGGDGTSWEDPANWDSGSVPTFADDVIIGGANMVTISANNNAANSLRINMTAQLMIMPSGVLSMNSSTPNGNMIELNNQAKLVNNGSVTVIGGDGNSINTNNGSEVTNNGFMNLIDPSGDPINMDDNSTFINNGTIFGNDGSDAIEMDDSPQFYNNGNIHMTNTSDEGLEMDGNSRFFNDGSLTISDVNNDPICLDDNNSRFFNTGMVSISEAGDNAIEVDDGRFENLASGVVHISNTNDDGIVISSDGRFINEGMVNIELDDDDGDENGITLESDTRFRNFNIVNIDYLGNSGGSALLLSGSDARLINEPCGVINLTSQNKIEISSATAVIRNEGVVATVFSGTHSNNGTFNNQNKINAPNGFMIAPNALVGGGTIDMNGPVPAQSACNINSGAVGCGGTTTYNAAQDMYTQTADGCFYAQSYTADEFSYSFQELCGNGEIVARVAGFAGQGWAGLMMREDLSPGSRKVQLMTNQSQLARREVRISPNGPAFPQQFPAYGHQWLRLVRNGNYFQGYISQNGVNWVFVMNQFVPMANCIHIGLVSTNYNQFNSSSTAFFDNVFFSSAPLATPDVPGELDIAFEELTEETISVYPNPTSGKLSIEVYSARDEVMDIRVMNALGQPVKSLALNPAETFREEVDLSGLASGMYYIHFQKADGETQIERVVLNANK